MARYIVKRLLHGLFSVICVVVIVMILIYSLLDRNKIFSGDPNFNHTASNNRVIYQQTRWEAFGYLDYVPMPITSTRWPRTARSTRTPVPKRSS